MPAQRPYHPRYHEDALSVRVEGDPELTKFRRKPKSVYFTDQSPCFTIVAKNTGNKPIEADLYIQLSFDASEKVYESGEVEKIELELNLDEIHSQNICADMLAYQGTAAISIRPFRLTERNGLLKVLTTDNHASYRLYNFMVYDRGYYKVNYLNPRYAQYTSALLATFIIVVGVIQILFELNLLP